MGIGTEGGKSAPPDSKPKISTPRNENRNRA